MLRVIYEDDALIVVFKPAGVEAQRAGTFTKDMVSQIRNYLALTDLAKGQAYVGVVHRLDKPVSGLMVYAKSPDAARALSQDLQKGNFSKKYFALVMGMPPAEEGILEDELVEDPRNNYVRVFPLNSSSPKGKRAKLGYRCLDDNKKNAFAERLHLPQEALKGTTLLEIILYTGRRHQIRAQLAAHGTPLYGDRRYGKAGQEGALALMSFFLSFPHPITGKIMWFQEEISSGEG